MQCVPAVVSTSTHVLERCASCYSVRAGLEIYLIRAIF
jgi:hypothetical protein